ncbi:MAG TPA: hypothetical protein VN737_03210 [Bryobacteraceae bacterium]|jgi:hypothetical protein|nr:hypothetical protein [Bryobacteraceae bacterium]
MDAAGIGVKQAFTNGDYSLGTFQTRDELPIALGVYWRLYDNFSIVRR